MEQHKVREFLENPCWLRLVEETAKRRDAAQAVRDNPGVSDRSERLHLGIVMAYNETLRYADVLRGEINQQKDKE